MTLSAKKAMIYRALQVPFLWTGIENTLGRISKFYQKLARFRDPSFHKQQDLYASFHAKFAQIEKDLTVRNGPFAGMRYPAKAAAGSAFYPKILGSYESELHGVIAQILQTPYDVIVDVGCAEGYYAVGLKMKMPGAKVFAYDTDERSRNLCEQLARLNQVDVKINSFFTLSELRKLDSSKRTLIFMDCEGYEYDLIDSADAELLRPFDFLIESHDFLRIDTTQKILDVLSPTHTCEIFFSQDDIIKAYNYHVPELEGFTLAERKVATEEYRNTIMRWILATPKLKG